MSIAFISHPACLLHDNGPHHPERPARIEAVAAEVGRSAALAPVIEPVTAPAADRQQLGRVHDPVYLDTVFAAQPESGWYQLDADTAMGPHSLEAALRAAGAGVEGIERVLSGRNTAAFCNVRPPGHHAERAQAMGFCIFNNVAVAAAHAMAAHGLERVAIVDFDVHHGNGTEDIFRDDERVLFCSSFQHPLYPGTGADTRSDHILNVPLAAGTDGAGFRRAVADRWFAALDRFAPQLVLVSAGFDAHLDDPLADLCLVEADYAWISRELKRIADAHAGGRICSLLEGGYATGALGRSAVQHLMAIGGLPVE